MTIRFSYDEAIAIHVALVHLLYDEMVRDFDNVTITVGDAREDGRVPVDVKVDYGRNGYAV